MLGWLSAAMARASRAKRLAVLGVVGLQDFERDVALEAGVAGPVDLAHATDPEQGYDFVGAQAMAWEQICGQAPLRASRSAFVRGVLEIPDTLANAAADIGQPVGAENQNDDEQNDEQLGYPEMGKHGGSFWRVSLGILSPNRGRGGGSARRCCSVWR